MPVFKDYFYILLLYVFLNLCPLCNDIPYLQSYKPRDMTPESGVGAMHGTLVNVILPDFDIFNIFQQLVD